MGTPTYTPLVFCLTIALLNNLLEEGGISVNFPTPTLAARGCTAQGLITTAQGKGSELYFSF